MKSQKQEERKGRREREVGAGIVPEEGIRRKMQENKIRTKKDQQ